MVKIYCCIAISWWLHFSCPVRSEQAVVCRSSIQQTPVTKSENATIVGVKDGDTVVVLIDGKEQVVRLAHIDCPEKRQPFGTKSKQFVSDKCFSQPVVLIHNNKYDRNKRLIAEIQLNDGTVLNQELVKNGLAWHFKKFSADKHYAQLETEARTKKIGLWGDKDPVAPWEWRKPKIKKEVVKPKPSVKSPKPL